MIRGTLAARGLLADTTSTHFADSLSKFVKKTGKPSVYCGYDPSASSLHVGNLVTLMALKHFQQEGYRPVVLIGGATGLIGDPSGKSVERPLLSPEEVQHNIDGITKNISQVLDMSCATTGAKIVNNLDWHGKMSAVDWIRDVGRHFRMGAMLGRESVRRRLDSPSGLNFTEFSYQIFQAYDFLHLYRHENCFIQVGGMDQWGNITAGCELVRRTLDEEVMGVTVPLLTTASGEKLGKSAGNAVWMSADRTSPLELYQYLLQRADEDVEALLLRLTLMPADEVEGVMEEQRREPQNRTAQRSLALQVVGMLHGGEAAEAAAKQSQILFGGGPPAPKAGGGEGGTAHSSGLDAATLLAVAGDTAFPLCSLSRDEVLGQPATALAVSAGVVSSKGAARRLISAGGLYLNNVRVTPPEGSSDRVVETSDLIDGQVLLFRSGKKKQFLIQVVE